MSQPGAHGRIASSVSRPTTIHVERRFRDHYERRGYRRSRVPTGLAAARAWAALPPDVRERTAVVGQICPVAAAVDVHGTPEGTPLAYSPHRGHGYFAPPPESADAALRVGVDAPPDTFRGGFTTCAPRPVEGLSIELCTGRNGPWPTVLAPTVRYASGARARKPSPWQRFPRTGRVSGSTRRTRA